MNLKAIKAIDDAGAPTEQLIAQVYPANAAAARKLLAAPIDNDDGRSPWVWVLLQNGDLLMATFPQGDTYCALEEDVARDYQTAQKNT